MSRITIMRFFQIICAVVLLASGNLYAQVDLALNKVASASTALQSAANAVDGNAGTRWESAFATDPSWLSVDLGAQYSLTSVVIDWEAANAATYQLQGSTDGTTWVTLSTKTGGTFGNRTDTNTVTGTYRYVRMYGTARTSQYGYSIWSFKVYGGAVVASSTPASSISASSIAAGTNLALGHVTAASTALQAAANAVDGNAGTRWESAQGVDPSWISVDLGAQFALSSVVIDWEAANAANYQIQGSNDNSSWTTMTARTGGTFGNRTDSNPVIGTYRYVRIYGTTRSVGNNWGYSIFELKVFGLTAGSSSSSSSSSTSSSNNSTLATSDTPNFGPNVTIFDSTNAGTVQSTVDAAFNAQLVSPTAQFGGQRYVFLFKPGTYNGFINLGFYTAVAGLGQNPDDVTLQGAINVDAGWNAGDTANATQNFWRSAENLSVVPNGGTDRWAVSQAAPMRRVHIKGNLTMGPSNQDVGQGYASGGYIADSKIDGSVSTGSQQQWYTRDSNVGSWTGGVWNTVFSGVAGAPAQAFAAVWNPAQVYTTLGTTPVSRDKPYLYIDSAAKYRVFLPALRTNASGASWANGATAGTSLPMSQFYVAKPTDSTATLNTALSQGLNLFLTPGTYHLSATLNITRANTVVMGLGFPTLVPDNGVNAMSVADVDGVRIAGILFDAGTVNSPALLTVGVAGSTTNHSANPTTVQDVYFRIGGAVSGKATTSLIVNSSYTIVDHIWAWRADHGVSATGWTINTADTGVIVNGSNVLATGLFVEHYQKYEVIWNGENGKTIFFQNEMPYDAPDTTSWNSGTGNGYAAYKIANSVTIHEGWGMGSYCYFNANPSNAAARGFEVPENAGVKMHDLFTVSLGGVGSIINVINTTGATAQGTSTIPVIVVSYH